MRSAYVRGAALAAFMGLVPITANAATPDELEARVKQLEEALIAVRAELASAKAAPIQLPAQQTPPAVAPAPPPADGFRAGPHTVKLGGFVKLDAIASDFDGGDPVNSDFVRAFYLPGAIPIGGAGETETHFNAKQTRIWLTTSADIAGHKVGSRVEIDFQALPGGADQRTTSPANPSLRRAFVTVDNWLFGQEWSTFQNVAVLPESADYIGPTEGTVFVRQAQVRYTRGPFSIAAENPETTITPFGGGARIVSDDAALPDLVARIDLENTLGGFSLAALGRQLAYEQGATDADATAWGLSAAGKIKLGARDDLRVMFTYGEGIGRYVGVNFANDAVLTAGGDLQTIPVAAGFVALRHFWTDTLRSSAVYSMQDVDNDVALTGAGANASASSSRINLIWTPVKGFDVGVEAMTGERELESGESGRLDRVQAFAKFGF